MRSNHKLGVWIFWLTWPLLWVYLRWSYRTRLLIVCGNEFLVVRSWLGPGVYGLPGGGIEKGEKPIHGIIREVSEEIGLDIQAHQLKHLYSDVSHSQGFRFKYECFLFTLDKKPDLKLQANEIVDAQWQPLNNPTLPFEHDVFRALSWWHDNR